jgi:hypothetical protein
MGDDLAYLLAELPCSYSAQRAFFVSFIKADSLLLKHWHKVASTDQSYESMALERLARFNGDSNVLDLGACRSVSFPPAPTWCTPKAAAPQFFL